jgi:ComF family protein
MLRAVAYHEGALRDAIHALKYQGRRRVARPLGDLLAHHLQKWAVSADVVVPVPLHTDRRRQRGFNQAELLAMRCASQLGVAHLPKALVRLRPTRPQVGLSAEERRANVAQAFVPGRQATVSRLSGKRIVLVDDVTTTGSTLSAAAVVLASFHPEAIIGVALARPVPAWLPATHVKWPEVPD